MHRRAALLRRAPAALLLAATLAACEEEPGAEHAEAPDPANIGRCAQDVRSRALIGVVVGVGTDPETDSPAYLVRLETNPSDTAFVGAGAPVVDCEEVMEEMREENPEPVFPPAEDTAP